MSQLHFVHKHRAGQAVPQAHTRTYGDTVSIDEMLTKVHTVPGQALLTETFQGSNTLINGSNGQPVTGFDNAAGTPPYVGASNPVTLWGQVQPIIDSQYPCPGGGSNALLLANDEGNMNFTNLQYIWGLNIREFWYRWYIRFGDATSFDDFNGTGNWVKLMRVYSQTWAWDIIITVYDFNTTQHAILTNENPHWQAWLYPNWVPAKWYYNEVHIIPNTALNSHDGFAEFWSRNVSDNLSTYYASFSNQDFFGTGFNAEYVGTVRIGGNAGGTGPPAPPNGVLRYDLMAFSITGRVGEA